MLHYLAGEEKIATIAAWCASDNIGSRRAMEKAGMVKVRVEKGALAVGDATFDRLWYEHRGEGAEKDAWPRDASTIAWRIASTEWFCLSGPRRASCRPCRVCAQGYPEMRRYEFKSEFE